MLGDIDQDHTAGLPTRTVVEVEKTVATLQPV